VGLSDADVLAEIQKIVAAQLDFKSELKLDDELIADLELDSLALVTLAVAVEDHFKIALPEDGPRRPRTVADLCRLVRGQVRDTS